MPRGILVNLRLALRSFSRSPALAAAAVVSGALPAWRGARVAPSEALRGE